MRGYRYQLYGLGFWSDLELPELAMTEAAPCDVEIRLVERLEEDGAIIAIDDVASFRVETGRRIDVLPAAGAPAANVRLFLLGSAMGLLLHQRGDLPLHGNALAIGGKAVAFLGASGVGKSSLAHWMLGRGVRPVSDDVCVVRTVTGARPTLFPGVPRLRLWEDALERGGLAAELLSPVFEGDPAYRKFTVPIEAGEDALRGLPLAAAYILDPGAVFAIAPLSGSDAVEALYAHTYRGEYVGTEGMPSRHWQQCVELAASLPMFKVRRSMELAKLDVENERLLDHVLSIVGDVTPA